MRPSGDFWRKKWFRTYKELPRDAHNGGRDWDTAYSKEEANSATAHILSYRGVGSDDQFPIYIHDVDWDWKEYPEAVAWMKSIPGPHFVEQKATGKSLVQSLTKEGVAAEEVVVKGDKFARAAAVQTTVANRRIYVNEAIIDSLLLGERQGLLRVTAEALLAGRGDLDVNDVFVQAITRHLELYEEEKEDDEIAFR